MASGVLSFGLGVVLTVTQNISKSLFALFRVAQLTGTLFFIAGLLSNLLFKYPRLLPVCFPLNLGCIIVGVVGVILIIVDLTQWDSENYLFKIEMLALAVLALKILLSIIICVFTWIETWSRPS